MTLIHGSMSDSNVGKWVNLIKKCAVVFEHKPEIQKVSQTRADLILNVLAVPRDPAPLLYLQQIPMTTTVLPITTILNTNIFRG